MGHMFIKRRGFKKRVDNSKRNEQGRRCFNCGSLDHLQNDCPYKKKNNNFNKRGKFEKKKREARMTLKKGKDGAFMVTWESDYEEEEEEFPTRLLLLLLSTRSHLYYLLLIHASCQRKQRYSMMIVRWNMLMVMIIMNQLKKNYMT